VNHALRIWREGEGPVLLKTVDDMRKSAPERVCNLYAGTGAYFIAVGHGERDIPRGSKEDSYRLSVYARPALVEELEPNDGPSDATPIRLGEEFSGFFSPSYNRQNAEGETPLREEDWFTLSIELPDGKPVLISAEISGVPGVNSALSLFNHGLDAMASCDANGPGLEEKLDGVGILSPGTYYIMACSKNFGSNGDAPYRLTVNVRDYDPSLEMEPNDRVETANPLGGEEVRGKIFPAGDRDCYHYTGGDGAEFYRIDAVPPEGLDLVLSVMGRDGSQLFEINNAGAGEAEIFPNARPGGDFYVAVESRRGTPAFDGHYSLRVAGFSSEGESELEPNDRKEQATRIRGSAITGFISRKKDVDYYSVEYGKRARCAFQLKGVKNSELRISITDPMGYTVKSAELKGDRVKTVSETIDQKGYIIIETLAENYEEPYALNILEAR
jgi:hypothetical protein